MYTYYIVHKIIKIIQLHDVKVGVRCALSARKVLYFMRLQSILKDAYCKGPITFTV
jgi:hypothetical protein